MPIALAFVAYIGGAVMNQVSAATETTATKAAYCENDACRGGWLFGYCRNNPGGGGGCDMTWLLGCRNYECGTDGGME